jgi:succinate-semialdehyde dehydrogenase / glutarate-semialdehyde dehydrogenase
MALSKSLTTTSFRMERNPEENQMIEYAVRNPATGELVRSYETATDSQITAALEGAQHAYKTWGRTSTLEERIALVRRVAELHRERQSELAALIIEEMGKPLEEAEGEVDFSAAIYDYYADNAAEFLKDEEITLLAGDGTAYIKREPLGVLLGIMPWNFPAYQIARFAGPNLCLGNTILLKHAPQCPSSSAFIEQIFTDAGFPNGAYTNLYSTNEQIADIIIPDPRVQGVSLTGSERAGSAVAEVAGRHLKKVVLELGGADPFLVLGTDNMDATVEAALAARLGNTGQACNAGKRMIVVADLYEEFVEKFTAKMKAFGIAPLSSQLAADRLQEQIDQATESGAELDTVGEVDAARYPAGVLTAVTKDNPVFYQELFGPVAMVFKVADENEAVELANDTPYGLGSYVFTNDPEQARRVADQIEAGMVFVNVVDADGVELPFGGIKRSGVGRELGRFGIEEFVNRKMIRVGA